MRTSESPLHAKFGKLPFHELGWIGARKPSQGRRRFGKGARPVRDARFVTLVGNPPSAQRLIASSNRPCGLPLPKTARNVSLGIFVFSDSRGWRYPARPPSLGHEPGRVRPLDPGPYHAMISAPRLLERPRATPGRRYATPHQSMTVRARTLVTSLTLRRSTHSSGAWRFAPTGP